MFTSHVISHFNHIVNNRESTIWRLLYNFGNGGAGATNLFNEQVSTTLTFSDEAMLLLALLALSTVRTSKTIRINGFKI